MYNGYLGDGVSLEDVCAFRSFTPMECTTLSSGLCDDRPYRAPDKEAQDEDDRDCSAALAAALCLCHGLPFPLL